MPHRSSPPSRLCFPLTLSSSFFDAKSLSPPPEATSAPATAAFPPSVRISGLKAGPTGASGGPAFVGQVFSMCDLSGTGLMAVSTHFDIPFISQRTPEWLKKMFATITRSERQQGPVFRFFLDLGDAVSYVKRLNIPSGVVGACRLDLAYEHFKEKPDLFQFVPNEKQVKVANKLLKAMPQNSGCKKVEGVPVFSAQNLDIAIATNNGIKWYTPYFFDKGMLDNILEDSVDQHFQSLIQTRHVQRRKDVIDDNLAGEVIEEMSDNLWEPPEVQEVMDEVGGPGIPLSVITKAAEMQLLYAVDNMILGNRWLRKATGIQPKFPYLVDSFERRTAASVLRASSLSCLSNSKTQNHVTDITPELEGRDVVQINQETTPDLRLPFGDWFGFGSKQNQQTESSSYSSKEHNSHLSPFLPKITMVGISTADTGQMNKNSLKKTMDELTKELENIDEDNTKGRNDMWSGEVGSEDRDPLFVANVGDYHSGLAKTGSARWVRGGSSNPKEEP